ncbi:CotH kinase family protein [Alistipes sp.]|uniref:CotH kinase family protein n=1 Tax=Alistipes sp. TaxID=1872444 RepID=UPI003AF09D9A
MKFASRFLIPCCTLLAGLLAGACSDNDKQIDDLPEPPSLTVSRTTFGHVDVDGTVLYATVASTRTAEVDSSEEWCEAVLLADTEKDNLRLTVLANPEERERTATVTVSAPECDPVTVTVAQAARTPEPYLTLSAGEFPEVTSTGETLSVTITTNQSGVRVESSEKWCEAAYNPTLTKDNLTLTVAANPGPQRTATVTVSVPACEPKQIVLTQLKKVNATCDLLTFGITKAKNLALTGDLKITFDKSARTLEAIYLKWIGGANPELMIPTFTHNGEKVLVNGQPVVSDQTKISLADDVALEVVAENGDKKVYTVSLNCPQINTELAVLHMQPASEIVGKEYYVDTRIELFDKSAGATGMGWWNTDENGKTIEMRGRGNSTWGLPKKPFRMKFPEKFSPVGLDHAKAKSWVLLAQDMDKSLVRNHIALQYSRILFNRAENYHDQAAVLFTASSKYVNVYFTGTYYDSSTGRREQKKGDYLGVYQMSDQLERAKGRIEVDELDDTSPTEDIEGGYIIETDIHEGNFYSSMKRIKMSYKYPKDDECKPEQYEYITGVINRAEQALYASDYKDPANGWRKYFDEKSLADFIIVKELAGDMDGFTSTYMYKRRGVDKLFFGPIWDCDKGWDNDKRIPHGNYPPLSSLMIHAGFWMPSYVENDWFWRFWEDETFRAFVAERWKAKKPELLAATDRILNEVPVDMAKAIEANFTVWDFYYQYSDEAKMPARTYPEEIERVRTLTRQRAALLDKLFNK